MADKFRPCKRWLNLGYGGLDCPYKARYIVVLPMEAEPFLVCGYHARGYLTRTLYDLRP